MPEIMTKRLALLPYLYPSKELMRIQMKWLNDPEVMKYSEHRHTKAVWQHCYKYIQSFDHQRNHLWAILDKEVKRHPHNPWEDFNYMGHITAHCDPYNKTAQIGILIGNKTCWGQGYGAEAWQAVCDWVLANGGRKVEAGCMAANTGMIRVFDKTGMVADGRKADHFLLEGSPVDLIQTARFRSESS